MVLGVVNLFGVEAHRRLRRRHARALAHGDLAGRRRPRDPTPSSTAPTPRRCAAPPPARPGRSGSWRAGRPRRAAGAGGPGRCRRATSRRRCSSARPEAALALRSFVAALGLYDAMVAVTGRPELFALKWPNDVLLAGRQARRHPARGAGRGGTPRHRHRRQPRRGAGPRGAGAGRGAAGQPARGDRHRGRRRRSSSTCSPRRSQALGGAAAPPRASRRSAPPGWRAPRGSARRSPRGCPAGRSPGASRRVDETGALVLATAERAGWRCPPPRSISPRRRRMLLAIDVGNTNTVFARPRRPAASSASGAAAPSASAPPTSTSSGCAQLMDLGGIDGDDRLGGDLLGGAAGASSTCACSADRYFHTRAAGGRQARGAAAGRRRGSIPTTPGRRRPAGQHRRRLRPLRRRPDRRRLRHRHHLRRRRPRRRLRRRRDRARRQPVAQGAARRRGGAAVHRRDASPSAWSAPTPSPACSRASTGATSG